MGFTQIKEDIEKMVSKEDKRYNLFIKQWEFITAHIESMCGENPEYKNKTEQEHKTFKRMWDYVQSKAKEVATNGVAMVCDEDVYAWVDEYFDVDDKEEYEKEIAENNKPKTVTTKATKATKKTEDKPKKKAGRPKKKKEIPATVTVSDDAPATVFKSVDTKGKEEMIKQKLKLKIVKK